MQLTIVGYPESGFVCAVSKEVDTENKDVEQLEVKSCLYNELIPSVAKLLKEYPDITNIIMTGANTYIRPIAAKVNTNFSSDSITVKVI